MCLPAAIKDQDSHLNLPKGCQNLGGTDALGYVRMRKADPRGDLGRVERQRQMLAAVAKEGARHVVVSPVGFVCDHVEVLYDLDVEARWIAAEHGVTLHRAPAMNAHPEFVAMLADLVHDALDTAPSPVRSTYRTDESEPASA